MTWNDEDERELRHVAAMIDELCRVDARVRDAATTAVMRPAYWRTRLETIRGRVRAGSRAVTVVQVLIDRLDELDRRHVHIELASRGKR